MNANQTALAAYNKLMPWILGPFCVKWTRPKSLVKDEHEMDNVAPTDRVTQAPHTEQSAHTDSSRTRQ